ncbi:MAG: DUF6089 family protein [Bacteroidia bacterium]
MFIKKNSGRIRKIIAAFTMLLLFSAVSAQHSLGYFLGVGVVYYNGDLNERSSKLISSNKVFKPFLKVGLNYSLGKRTEATLGFFYGNVGGADSLAAEKDNRERNLSFKSVIEDLSLQLEYHLFSFCNEKRLNPFIFAGAGVFHFNPTTVLNGVKYELQPVGTEGQYIGSGDHPKLYKLTQVNIPVGIGIYFQLNTYWRLKIHYANHFTFTDFLDDVSTAYPDSTLLSKTPQGNLAVQLSSRRLNGIYPPSTVERGNRELNDSFSEIGITIIYNPKGLISGRNSGSGNFKRKGSHKFNKKNLCPAYD